MLVLDNLSHSFTYNFIFDFHADAEDELSFIRNVLNNENY